MFFRWSRKEFGFLIRRRLNTLETAKMLLGTVLKM